MWCTGQVETTKPVDTLVAITGEGQINEKAKATDLPQLEGEIEDATMALRVTLLVHAHDHLAVETMQQFFKLAAQHGHVGTALVFAEAGAQHLIAFFAGALVEELIKTKQAIGPAQHRIHQHIHRQLLVHVLQAHAHLTGEHFQLLLTATQKGFHQNGHQYTIERTIAAAFTRQVPQVVTGAAADFGVRLGQVTEWSVLTDVKQRP